jgi:hypothetical protein
MPIMSAAALKSAPPSYSQVTVAPPRLTLVRDQPAVAAPPPPGGRHLAHVATLLRVLAQHREQGAAALPGSPSLFLVREEGDAFWELVGLRVRGLPHLLVAALRFARQANAGPHARRSLCHYLCSPPKDLGLSRIARPSHLVEFLMPSADETIPEFQARMQARETPRSMFLDVDSVDYAFDFRTANPSVDRGHRPGNHTPECHLFRTSEGHVLSGMSHGLHAKLHGDQSFVVLRDAVQHGPGGDRVLPTLVLHRRLVSADARLDAEGPAPWLQSVPPFVRSMAHPRFLLAPDARP